MMLQVNCSGTYHLISIDKNYKDYLLALELPEVAVEIIARS